MATDEPARRFVGIKRVALVSASALAAINIWTGAPLLAVWVGSQTAGESGLSMTAVFVVIVVIAVVLCVLVFEFWFFFFAGSSLPSQ